MTEKTHKTQVFKIKLK